jgi:ATP-dependent DNA helicase RecQ
MTSHAESSPVGSQALEALRRFFGFGDFRAGQREVVESVLAGHDTVVVMPTGGGKSLCYQLPALMREGATIVVSPLIALMKDQTDALAARNLPATFINSSISFEEQRARIAGVRAGRFKLVYIAPERFRSQHFTEALKSAHVSLFAVDEAHCISSWGHDFRPDYLRLKSAIDSIGRPQIIALTATATPYVRADIIEQLALREPRAFVSGFDRPNLSINVTHTQKETEKIAHVRALARTYKDGSGIIYTSTRKAVEQVAGRLQNAGLETVAYHAGIDEAARERAQDDFMAGRKQMIVATNAFGMGIDKPDIRFVAHYHMPGSIEAYYQEIGRAGRDSLPASCVLLFNYADKRTQDYFIEGSYPPPETIARVYSALAEIGQNQIELSTREIAARAQVRNEMAVQSALIILEKAGHIERGAGVENRAAVRLKMKPEKARETVAARRSQTARQTLFTLLGGYDVKERADIDIDLADLAETLGLDTGATRRALAQLSEWDIISFQPARRTRGLRMLDDPPARNLRIRPTEIARRAALEQRKLREIIEFCYTKNCYRAFILDYFGDREHPAQCGTCGNCAREGARTEIDNSLEAAEGEDLIVPLEPSSDFDRFVSKHTPFALDLEQELNDASRRNRMREAAETAFDSSDEDSEITSGINVAEPRALDTEETLRVRKILACAARMEGRFGKNMLALTLKGSRSQKITNARLDNLKSYGILADMTQEEITTYIDALVRAGCLHVTPGPYPTIALTRLGDDVMRERTNVQLALASPKPRPTTINDTKRPARKIDSPNQTSTVDETYRLYESGLTIEQIAAERGMVVQTIEKHLADAILENRPFDITRYVSNADRRLIEAAIAEHGSERLKPIRDALPARISYRVIRFIAADLERTARGSNGQSNDSNS